MSNIAHRVRESTHVCDLKHPCRDSKQLLAASTPKTEIGISNIKLPEVQIWNLGIAASAGHWLRPSGLSAVEWFVELFFASLRLCGSKIHEGQAGDPGSHRLAQCLLYQRSHERRNCESQQQQRGLRTVLEVHMAESHRLPE